MTGRSYRRTIWLSLLTTALAGGALYADTTDPEPPWCLNGESVMGTGCAGWPEHLVEAACQFLIENSCNGMVVRNYECHTTDHPEGWLWCEWGN